MNLPISQLVVGQETYISGQVGLLDGVIVEGGFKAQLRQALSNLRAVLAENGLAPVHVLKVNVFLVNAADFSALNEIYIELFSERPYPARTTVVVAGLPLGALVEVDAIATRSRCHKKTIPPMMLPSESTAGA